MSREEQSRPEVPVPSKASSISLVTTPSTPPKRFLGVSSSTAHLFPSKRLFPVPSLLSSSDEINGLSVGKSHSSPPKLTRFPTVLLTPVNITQHSAKGNTITAAKPETSSLAHAAIPTTSLPPPPPLIKMPVGRRKEAISPVVVTPTPRTARKRNEGSEVETSTVEVVAEIKKQTEEPPQRRTRGTTAEKSGETNSRGSGGSTTPRKIIQEIFGPDKSKRPKGKGRKKRRGGAATVAIPKKKILAEVEEDEMEVEETEVITIQKVHEGEVEMEGEQQHKRQELENSIEGENEANDEKINMDSDQQMVVLENEEVVGLKTEKDEDVEIAKEEMANKSKMKDRGESKEVAKDICDQVETFVQEEVKEEQIEQDDVDEEIASIIAASTSSLLYQASGRNAKLMAKERITRFSQSEDLFEQNEHPDSDSTCNEEVKEEKDEQVDSGRMVSEERTKEDEDEISSRDGSHATGTVQSRRSTTDCSFKSGSSSLAQPDSESSAGMCGDGRRPKNTLLAVSRQLYNATPSSTVSDDDDDDDDEDGADGNGSGSDDDDDGPFLSHKDSDLESTYSWKPVRAAAAAALEQVTKNQQGAVVGNNGLPVDVEAKAAAAAERRARKINRYKGRNRRTLMFKSGSSKKHTAQRHSRYSAVPTITHKMFHRGQYFQTGDLVYVVLANETPCYGQIRGLMMDHFGETSAGVRFLAPKHPVYAFMDFDPANYSFRYDIPERLIKIEFVNFVMHLNLDHFEGQPSFKKIEKHTVYTRMGKSLQESYLSQEEQDSIANNEDSSIDSCSSSTSSSDSEDENGETRKKRDSSNRKDSQGRRSCHISDSSSSTDDDDGDDSETTSKTNSGIVALPTGQKQGDSEKEEQETEEKDHGCGTIVDDIDIIKQIELDETPD